MRPRTARPIPRRRCCASRQLNTDTGYRLGMSTFPARAAASWCQRACRAGRSGAEPRRRRDCPPVVRARPFWLYLVVGSSRHDRWCRGAALATWAPPMWCDGRAAPRPRVANLVWQVCSRFWRLRPGPARRPARPVRRRREGGANDSPGSGGISGSTPTSVTRQGCSGPSSTQSRGRSAWRLGNTSVPVDPIPAPATRGSWPLLDVDQQQCPGSGVVVAPFGTTEAVPQVLDTCTPALPR
jgi:hypothetical protein